MQCLAKVCNVVYVHGGICTYVLYVIAYVYVHACLCMSTYVYVCMHVCLCVCMHLCM